MPDDDEEIRASLRRLAPEPSTDGVLDVVTRRRDRLVRRRRALTVVASVAVVAILGGAIAVAASPDDDTDRVVVDSPTTLPASTTTTTSTTSTTMTSTTSTTTAPTTTTTTSPVDLTACTGAAVAASLDLPPEHVFDGPRCVASYAVAGICDPAGSEVCLEGRSVLALSDGRWTLLGRMLHGCLEDLLAYVPEDVAVRFDDHRWCTWTRLLDGAVLEPGGLGAIRIGMTVADLEAATGLTVVVADGEGVGGCRWADVGVEDLTLIVRAGVVVNITIYPNRRTDTGLGHGSSQDTVLQAYPGAEVQPNIWSLPNGLWISSPARDHPQAITYETDGTRVTAIQAGRHMPEGCHP